MLRQYVGWFRDGVHNPRPLVKKLRETPATAVLDADNGLGVHVGPQAMAMAVEKAKAVGMGCVSVRNAGHLGGAGYHAMVAAKAGCIGQCFGAPGGNLTVPTFGAEPRFGTHPVAWAAPAGAEAPFLFDIATTQVLEVRTLALTLQPAASRSRYNASLTRHGTAQVAGNKIRLAARMGRKLAPNWIAEPQSSPEAGRVIEDEVHAPSDFLMPPLGELLRD